MIKVLIFGTGNITDSLINQNLSNYKFEILSWRGINFLTLYHKIIKLSHESSILINGFNKNIYFSNIIQCLILIIIIKFSGYEGKIIFLNTHCLSSTKYKSLLIGNNGYSPYLLIKFLMSILLNYFCKNNLVELFLPPVINVKHKDINNIINNSSDNKYLPFYAININSLSNYIIDLVSEKLEHKRIFPYSFIVNSKLNYMIDFPTKPINLICKDLSISFVILIEMILRDLLVLIFPKKFGKSNYLRSFPLNPISSNPFPNSFCPNRKILYKLLDQNNIVLTNLSI